MKIQEMLALLIKKTLMLELVLLVHQHVVMS